MGSWFKHFQHISEIGACPLSLSAASKHQQTKVIARENELINIAHHLVVQDGFTGLTMDKLVKASSYSKGTIYNHFSSKEDLISALSARSLSVVIDLFNQAMLFEGNARERALAIQFSYQLYCQLEPILFLCVLTAKTPAVMEKTSLQRNELLKKKERQLIHTCDHVFQQGVADGSLTLSANVAVHDAVFAAWSMAFGTNALLITASAAEGISRLDQKYALLRNVNFLLDGMEWQPLSSNFDYHKTWQRLEDYFANYMTLLAANE